MSSVAIPLTKPAGARPPFGGPPQVTTFDGGPDDGGDSVHRRLADSIEIVLRACRHCDAESAPLLRRLIDQRRKAVLRELDTLRMLEPSPLPPLLANFYSVEFLTGSLATGESEAERLYIRLLASLDLAETHLAGILGERNG